MCSLLANGQLEFVGGGWVQSDEAVAMYEAVVNQMTEVFALCLSAPTTPNLHASPIITSCLTLFSSICSRPQGHLFLLETFGVNATPRLGWQIDPFGASSATPRMVRSLVLFPHLESRSIFSSANA
jgi:hypothetical protein